MRAARSGAERDYAGRHEPDRESHVGEMFGRYRLDALLGAGGVGEVWRARDTALDRVVAIKMLLPRFRDDPESAARFLREAQMAARLRHSHIVNVHNFGEIDGRLFLEMELVGGSSLAATLAGGPLAPRRAVEVVEVIADALDTAHALGEPADRRMVHRDVKPANVLLEPRPGGREHVYLVDFGVARTVAPGASITGEGAVVGTPSYMAPELWEGTRADHRIDVYALAVTLFETLTGQLPFQRHSLVSIITAHLTASVPAPSAVRDEVPAAFDAVIARGMAKDPDHRYGSAGELARAAAAALTAPAPATRQPAPVTPRTPAHPSAPPPSGTPTPARARPSQPAATTSAATTSVPVVPTPIPAAPAPTTARSRTDLGPRPATPQGATPWPPPGPTPRPAPRRPDPDRPDAGTGPPTRRPYLGSAPHFAGLAATVLLLPLYLSGLLRADWTLLVVLVLLYALGVSVATVLRRPESP